MENTNKNTEMEDFQVLQFNQDPVKIVSTPYRDIYFFEAGNDNIDLSTVTAFGEEWTSFHSFSEREMEDLGDLYFDLLEPGMLTKQCSVLEVGCGSGRFIWYLRDKAGKIVGLDPSNAIFSANELIGASPNISLVCSSASNIPFKDESFDFVYSIGVLHHIPDTQAAMQDCVSKLKPGGYFLTYLYYDLDNRNIIYKGLYKISNLFRLIISKLPAWLKKAVCDLLAILFYMPFVLLCRVLKWAGVPTRIRQKIPLFAYEERSFYVIRNDSLDRFGTPLEKRFSKKEIYQMMAGCNLSDIRFSENIPYWHAIGKKK